MVPKESATHWSAAFAATCVSTHALKAFAACWLAVSDDPGDLALSPLGTDDTRQRLLLCTSCTSGLNLMTLTATLRRAAAAASVDLTPNAASQCSMISKIRNSTCFPVTLCFPAFTTP